MCFAPPSPVFCSPPRKVVPPEAEVGFFFTRRSVCRVSRQNTAMRIPKRLWLAAGVGALAARRVLNTAYDLQGKRVLITGGSRGLGLALAQECLTRGAQVLLMARNEAELASARSLLGDPQRVHTFAGDVTKEADLEGVLAYARQELGGLDVIINNAGIIQTGPLGDMTEEDFRSIMEVNAFAPLRLSMLARPLLRGGGRVLIVSSVGGKLAVPHLAPYSVSKFASAGLGQALRAELAREGIAVTTVLPGLMRTGSPRQAQVKGQYEQEYAFFATLDNLPVVSLDARTAARRIIDALVRGDAEAMIGGPALLMRYAQALAPQLTADLLALSNRFLPGPTGNTAPRTGKEVESSVTRSNPIKQQAEQEFNQGH